ncbi:hypothetical protein B0O99DRAFT_626562 [Bisporella sp. PMI_857]|nr:hypothetical protein B0O99DRAFT_626562 [Bisporella sp. PMI_857]
MANIESGNMEIFVHATAPSLGQDDIRYRALAQAYIDFEPETRERLISWNSLGVDAEKADDAEEASGQLQLELMHSTQEERESQASYKPDIELGDDSLSDTEVLTLGKSPASALASRWMPSPQMSFEDAQGNADSPSMRVTSSPRMELPVRSSQSSQNSWYHAPSTIEDSQPEPQAQATCSPSKVWEVLGQRLRAPKAISTQEDHGQVTTDAWPNLPGENQHENQDTMPSHASLTGIEPWDTSSEPFSTSHLEKSTCRNDILRDRSPNISSQEFPGSKRKGSPEVNDRTVIPSSFGPELPLPALIIEPETTKYPQKRQRILDYSLPVAQADSIASSMPSEITSSSFLLVASAWTEQLEVQPPPPKVSMKDLVPEDLVTESLHQLAKKLPFEAIYHPETQTRRLRPMERGYWLINSQTWEYQLRRYFWNALAKFIGEGRGGWGINCNRDEDFTSIRVYCWGITAQYIYLLLHTASQRKLRGARWIGGDGLNIIIMPP